MTDVTATITAHYGEAGLGARILAALDDAGFDGDRLHPEDLAPVDQLHSRGQEATADQARLMDFTPGMRVLDVGSGLGGPARYLAAAHGCHVTGIDLTEAFCQVAEMLSRRMGIGDEVEFRCGDARQMPFAAHSFDAAWTQYALMNIADKDRLFAEIHRVLKPGARFALSCVVAGPGGPLHFPVPWATEPSISFLPTADELRRAAEGAGFRIVHWSDDTERTLEWRRRLAAVAREDRPPLSPIVVFGPDFRTRVANIMRNLEENRMADVTAVAERTG